VQPRQARRGGHQDQGQAPQGPRGVRLRWQDLHHWTDGNTSYVVKHLFPYHPPFIGFVQLIGVAKICPNLRNPMDWQNEN
jgi:hypothetical protein